MILICVLNQSNIADEYQILMSSNGLVQLITSPTRGNRCIDHIYFRSRDNIIPEAFVLKSGRSDHDVTICNMIIQNITRNNMVHSDSPVVTKIDYNTLECLLSRENWLQVYSKNNVSDAFDMFLKIFKNVIDRSKFVSVRKGSVKILKPWMTYELCCRQQFRNALYKKVKRNPNNLIIRRRFDVYSLELKYDMNNQKANYYQNLFGNSKNNTKKQWQIINEVLGSKNKKNSLVCIEKMDSSGEILQDPLLMAGEFNKFFMSVVDKLMDTLDNDDGLDSQEYESTFPSVNVLNSFFYASHM